ncbi:MAG: response regulator [Gemmataceae bacterium]|nr:response regulator [Gemmataceae bacterium]
MSDFAALNLLRRLQSARLLRANWQHKTGRLSDQLPALSENELLAALVQADALTRFQAESVLAGKLESLLVGPYRLREGLSNAHVYQAEHCYLRQSVALRLVEAQGADKLLARAQQAAQLQNEVVVPVTDAGPIAASPLARLEKGMGGFYFTSPFIRGHDLHDWLLEHGPQPIDRSCAWILQAAQALADAHAADLVHGCLGPRSVRLEHTGQVRIVDFGLKSNARAGESPLLTLDEQKRRDVAGLALCLFWLLTHHVPNQSGKETFVPPRLYRADIPHELDRLLVEFTMGLRQGLSALALAEGLQPFLTNGSASPAQPCRALSPTIVLPMALQKSVSSSDEAAATRRVLLVDDEPDVRLFSRMLLESIGLECDEAANGKLALAAFAENHYDLVLLDLDMPELGGLATCREMRKLSHRPHLKIILFSGRSHPDEMAQMLLSGADDFLLKPVTAVQLQARIQAALKLKQAQERSDLLNRDLLTLNRELESHLHDRDSDLVEARNALVLALATLAENRDEETGAHLLRLQVFSRRLAQEALRHPALNSQLDDHFIDMLACCAPLHDIGKVGLPDHILLKPGKLNPHERTLMQTHTTIAAGTLKKVAERHGFALAFLKMSIDIARHHHERFDGSGYPDRLAGEAIPLAARIVTVCDVYDALRSRRIYKPALPHADVVQMIRDGAGTQFDPLLVQCFEQCAADFEQIYAELQD